MLRTPASPLQVTVVREIPASPEKVFATLISPQGMMLWAPKCRSAEWLHPPGATGPGIGSVRRLVLQGSTVATERIVAWDPGRELHYVMEGPMPVVTPLTRNYIGVTRVEAKGAGASQLTWQLHFDTPGLRILAAPLLRRLMQSAIADMVDKIAMAAVSA